MKRFLACFCFFYISTTATAMATDYQDWWWNPEQNGMGVNIGHQGNTIAAAWYLYDSDGSPSFLILSGTVIKNVVSGSLYRSRGPLPGPGYNPDLVDTTAVGSGSITFTSDSTAVLSYNYDGLNGSLALERFGFGAYSLDGDFAVASTFTRSKCQSPSRNFVTYDGLVATASSDGRTLLIDQWGPQCSATVELTQSGSIFEGAGIWSCFSGEGGTITFHELSLGEDHFIGRYTQIWTKGETCQEVGIVSGLEIP